jgi:SAM-dependent methyltransferase
VFQPYERSALYYDMFYSKLFDYQADCDLLERIFKKHCGFAVRSILDIGCGTGNHDFILAERGYNVTGVDLSENMIRIARRKVGRRRNPVFYRMDMRKVTINRKFDAVFALGGAFEYLLRNSDVNLFLKSTKRLLDGVLVFGWQQQYSPTGYWWFRIRDKRNKRVLVRLDTTQVQDKRNRRKLDFHWYVMNAGETRILDRFTESHFVRRYAVLDIKRFLAANGFQPLSFYGTSLRATKLKPASSSSFGVICVAKPS